MDKTEFIETYKIEEEKLYNYYERTKKQYENLPPIQQVVKFLVNNQLIGISFEDVLSILEYYEKKIVEENDILKFAFEWIRARKIRFEYKKYLSNAQYQNYELAVDDCIFRFFLDYDEFIRKFLKQDIKEFEISMLYEILFSPDDVKNLNLQYILEWHKINVPAIFKGTEKINTNLITLRLGLSRVIKNDFEKSKPKQLVIK